MNSIETDLLYEIDAELTQFIDISHDEMLTFCINQHLASTLKRYNEEVDATSEYLLQKSSVRVLKAITKIKKFTDKDIINQYMEDA